jgi:hypothetical protein
MILAQTINLRRMKILFKNSFQIIKIFMLSIFRLNYLLNASFLYY